MIKQVCSTLYEKPNYGTTFLKPFIIITRNDSLNYVLNAGHLNTNTDYSFDFWPLEPLVTQLAGAHRKYISSFDLKYAFAQGTLDNEAIK